MSDNDLTRKMTAAEAAQSRATADRRRAVKDALTEASMTDQPEPEALDAVWVSPGEAARRTGLTTSRLAQIANDDPTRLPSRRDARGHRTYRYPEVQDIARQRRRVDQALGLTR